MSEDDDGDDWSPRCSYCGFDSICRECWERDGTLRCHSCDAEGRTD